MHDTSRFLNTCVACHAHMSPPPDADLWFGTAVMAITEFTDRKGDHDVAAHDIATYKIPTQTCTERAT